MFAESRVASALTWVLVALFVAVLAVALASGQPSLPMAADEPEIPPDVLALGTDVTAASTDGKISADEAVAALERAWGTSRDATIETYLVNLSDPSVLIAARDVWIVKLSGVAVPFSIPDVPSGIPRPSATAGDVLYHYIDAVTGEWLVARTP